MLREFCENSGSRERNLVFVRIGSNLDIWYHTEVNDSEHIRM